MKSVYTLLALLFVTPAFAAEEHKVACAGDKAWETHKISVDSRDTVIVSMPAGHESGFRWVTTRSDAEMKFEKSGSLGEDGAQTFTIKASSIGDFDFAEIDFDYKKPYVSGQREKRCTVEIELH